MSASTSYASVEFVPFTTFIDPIFWSDVNQRKVNEWKLNSNIQPILATFTLCGKQPTGAALCISADAFEAVAVASDFEQYFTAQNVRGDFFLTNTMKEFVEELDRKAILQDCAEKLWHLVESKAWISNPDLLNYFYLTAYADIKQFVYYFWNCMPAFLYPAQIAVAKPVENAVDRLFYTANAFIKSFDKKSAPSAFVLLDDGGEGTAYCLDIIDTTSTQQIFSSDTVTLVFLNASSVPQKTSWNLRNLLAAVAFLRPDWTRLRVLALRHLLAESFIFHFQWDCSTLPTKTIEESSLRWTPKCVGWERNVKTGALNFRHVELKSMFDPLQIMEQSADLNLKLIRWQQAPSIQLDRFTLLKALIIGSGTLGCNLARSLLGWGVRRFTFIDHANVSYNNPIRQSLFIFEDCQKDAGAFNKAEAAAAALRRIYPRVDAQGIDMKIPMPGHPYSDEEKPVVMKICCKLDQLIREHDVVFLVMDSRESRWLPTLIASHYGKLAITVALGFDSYVVIRHGASPHSFITISKKIDADGYHTHEIPPSSSTTLTNNAVQTVFSTSTVVPGESLGCYFCSDVTAPGNSTVDRTLDQQCTISRSGVSMIASGIAVELLASVLQHELGPSAPALLAEVDENSSVLGGTPHQIRGFLSRFNQMTPTVQRFDQCTACGSQVRRKYASWRQAITNEENGVVDKSLSASLFDTFLHQVFHDSHALERITGLEELQASVEQLGLDMLEFDEDVESN